MGPIYLLPSTGRSHQSSSDGRVWLAGLAMPELPAVVEDLVGTSWVFLILLQLPSFGGDVAVAFAHQTEEGCLKMRRVVERQMEEMSMTKRTITACYAVPVGRS